ncbi:MAG: hypothetical protein M1835_006935 [Candelina submexicana]|nr:MAG: hypothetical protein M1835_006935 [Candelina submexicana]
MADNFQKTLIWALENSSPSSILQSEASSVVIMKLFQSLDLLPSASQSSSLSYLPPASHYLTEHSPAASKTRLLSTTESTPPRTSSNSSQPTFSFQPSLAIRYFRDELKINDTTRVQLLVEAARGFVKKLTVSPSSYEQLWSTKLEIFEQSKSGHISRTRRLYEGRRRIEQGSKRYDCAGRFALLFLRHDLDETVASSEKRTAWHGQKKVTVAYEHIAQDLSTTVATLKREKTHSRHYLSLLTKCGPGDLLELGDSVSKIWERKLGEKDIPILIRFRNEKFPEIDRYFRNLDFLGARTILDGLRAYGWTYEELSKCQGDLMTQLFRYVDQKQLAHGHVQASGREPCRKRRCSEQDNPPMELSSRSNAAQLHLDAIDSGNNQLVAEKDSTDDEKIEDTYSTISNATSHTSLSACAQEVCPGQEHRYKTGSEASSSTGLLQCVGGQGIGTPITPAIEIPDDLGLSSSGCNLASAPRGNCAPHIMDSTFTVCGDPGADTVCLDERVTEPLGVYFQPCAAPYAGFVDYRGNTTDVFGDEQFKTRVAPYAEFADCNTNEH